MKKYFNVTGGRFLIDQWGRKGHPVAGDIVEPIQAEGGDNLQ